MAKRKHFEKGDLVLVLWRTDSENSERILDPPIQVLGVITDARNLLQHASVYIPQKNKIYEKMYYTVLEPTSKNDTKNDPATI